jgi:hypothetical protein
MADKQFEIYHIDELKQTILGFPNSQDPQTKGAEYGQSAGPVSLVSGMTVSVKYGSNEKDPVQYHFGMNDAHTVGNNAIRVRQAFRVMEGNLITVLDDDELKHAAAAFAKMRHPALRRA